MSVLAPQLMDAPAGPDGKPGGPPPITGRLLLGLGSILLGAFVSNLDTRLTTFSLADLRGGVGYGQDEASWVSAAYNVAEIAVVPLTPWLASVISQRLSVLISIVLLTLGGALCPWAADHGYKWLVAMRFLQGLGGGALIPLLLGIFLRFLPLHQRVYGFALYALVTASTPLMSESLAGVLTDIVGWQSVFYIGAAFGPVVMFMAIAGLPGEEVKWEKFAEADYVGMLLMAVWASLLTVALGEGQRLDWFSSPLIDSLFAASAIGLAAFVLQELTTAKPLVDLRLFGRLNFSLGLVTVVVFAFTTLFTSTVLPNFGAEVKGFRELQVGDILIWAALAQVVVCAVAPFLMHRLEARLVLALGLLIAALGARFATFIDSDWVLGDLLASQLIQACGQPLIMVALIIVSTSTLQAADAVAGSTLFNVVRTLAGSIGGAVVGGILVVRERVHSSLLADHLASGAQTTLQAGGGLGAALHQQSATMAVADAYGWIGVVTVGAMVLPFALNQTKLFRAPAAQQTAAAE